MSYPNTSIRVYVLFIFLFSLLGDQSTAQALIPCPMRKPVSELTDIPWLIPHIVAIIICLCVAIALGNMFYERYKSPLTPINKKKLLIYFSALAVSLAMACTFTADNTRFLALQLERLKAQQGSQKSAFILGKEYYYADNYWGDRSAAKDAYFWLSVANEMFKSAQDSKEENKVTYYLDNARRRVSPEEANLIDNDVKNWIEAHQGAGD